MRTTLDLDLRSYRLAKAIAAQKGVSLGKVVAEALLAHFGRTEAPSVELGKSAAGFPVLSIGRPVTAEDVAELEDE